MKKMEHCEMKGFVEKVAEYLYASFGEEVGGLYVVVPNRRAGLFFQKALATLIPKPVWSPRVLAIRDFIEELSGTTLPDTMVLVLELYRAFREITATEETFDRFFPWGELLLNDFDDVDKYLLDAHDLFRNLSALKELSGDLDYLSDEQIELIRRFWEHFPASQGKHARSFLDLWEKLPAIYDLFHERLKAKDMTTEGMLYREVAERSLQEGVASALPGKVCFAGFNALTRAEETLFKSLRDGQKALFFWDYDRLYTGGTGSPFAGHDAGRFISRYLEMFPPPVDLGIFDNLASPDKKISIWSSPDRATQAWVVRHVLEQWAGRDEEERRRAAVVLADESLLLPVLHALPDNAGEVNVTMGFPLKASPVFAFFRDALQMVQNSKKSGSQHLFFYRDVLALLQSPVLDLPLDWISAWEEQINRQNRLYLLREEIPFPERTAWLFEVPGEITQLGSRIIDHLQDLLLREAREESSTVTDLNIEVLYRLSLLVNRFNDLIGSMETPPAPEGYLRLLLRLIEREKVAFYGEPLTGLQIMGVLETRLLDFERVIIVSVNEDTLPRAATASSFIPYNLRKGFGLPSWEHDDALYAYYFFRLIQRAGEVVLIYHSESENGMKGERSRYIEQLRYLMPGTIPLTDLSYQPGIRSPEKIVVRKDERVLTTMKELFREGGKQYLSPTAVNTYLDCRLKFYYRYVSGIREPEEMAEEIDHALFGRLIHRTLELFYDPHAPHHPAGGRVTKEWLDETRKNLLPSFLEKAMEDVLYDGKKHVDDRGWGALPKIIMTMVRNFVEKVLDHDRRETPFRIIGVEQKVEDRLEIPHPEGRVSLRIGGNIDRIDEKEGSLRIIDYKTGKGSEKERTLGALEDLFDRQRGKNRPKEILQILMYGLMYHPAAPVRGAIYHIRDMFGKGEKMEVMTPGEDKKKYPFTLDEEVRKAFRQKLTGVLEEMFDPGVPFDQTDREELCRQCPYRQLCEKETM